MSPAVPNPATGRLGLLVQFAALAQSWSAALPVQGLIAADKEPAPSRTAAAQVACMICLFFMGLFFIVLSLLVVCSVLRFSVYCLLTTKLFPVSGIVL